MKVSQAIEQLYMKLPFLTDKFTRDVGIVQVEFDEFVVSIKTDTAHGLEVGDTCTILGLYAPLLIDTMTRTNDKILVVTNSAHDLTQGFQTQVTIDGAEEEEFNGIFKLLQVIDKTNFIIETIDSGPTVATGAPILEQTTGSTYGQIVGYRTVTAVSDENTFSFIIQTSITATIESLGSVAIGFRITGAVDFNSALASYTDQPDGEYWAFVVSNANIASKDRKNNSDAILTYNGNTGYRQELNQTFTVFVFATASSHADAYPIKDDMQDMAVALINTLVGAKFDNGLEAENYYGNVFDTHLTQFYDKGIYAHSFIFQTTTQIGNADIFVRNDDVAFREIDLTMNVIVGDLQIKPDTQTLTAHIDL